MTPQLPHKKPARYAVVDLQEHGYMSLGKILADAFSHQIENMIAPAIASSVHSFVYKLLDKTSVEQYSPEFSKLLNDAVRDAFASDRLLQADNGLSAVYSAHEALESELKRISRFAQNLLATMDKINMQGNPTHIKQIMDFLHDLAFPNPAEMED
jgi:predicted ribosome quality control (RQC) complex YloA/Tae2 family protein